MIWPELFKIGANGQVLTWNIEVYNVNGNGVIKIVHGQLGGKLTESFERVEEGKNTGKANETTPVEQAISQAESKWQKQLDRAYREDVVEAKKASVASTKPMLAHKWDDKKHTIKLGEKLYVQPKLDGMRCLATNDGGEVFLLSRGGKPIESVPHIVEELKIFLPEGETWDGELYVHGMDFEEIISICKRKSTNLHPSYKDMEFHVFDAVSSDPFTERFERVLNILAPTTTIFGRVGKSRTVVHVPCTPLNVFDDGYGSLGSVQWEQFVTENLLPQYETHGYEGIILRKIDMPYEHKRTDQLIKLKSFQDAEFKIVGTQSGKKGSRQEDLLIKFDLQCTNSNGETETFEGTLMGTEDARRDMLLRREEYIGQVSTVKFQETSKYGVPRFAKVKGIRGKEDLCAIS